MGVIGDEGETENVSVTVGDSVTLHTQLTEMKGGDVITWWFNDSLIAIINKEAKGNPVYEPDERFTDRLKMNPQTGDLTITNIRSNHTGEYKLEINNDKIFTIKIFIICLSPEVNTVMDVDSVTLHIDERRNDKIHWKIKHKNSTVAEIITEAGRVIKNETYNGFRGRLKLNDQNGDLTITTMTKKDSGQYEADVTIGSNTYTIHKTFSFTDSEASGRFSNDGKGLSSGVIAGICVGVLLAIAVAVGVVVGVIYRHCKKKRQDSRTREEPIETNMPLRKVDTSNVDVP